MEVKKCPQTLKNQDHQTISKAKLPNERDETKMYRMINTKRQDDTQSHDGNLHTRTHYDTHINRTTLMGYISTRRCIFLHKDDIQQGQDDTQTE